MQKKVEFREAVHRKFPEQVSIAIVKDSKGKYNPITLGWQMWTSISPPMLAISTGKGRWSCEAIRQAKEFALSFPCEAQKEESLFYGRKSGRDMDKIAELGGKTQPCEKIDSVILADAVASFECKLVGELVTGDHVIFAGEVVASYANPEPVRRLYSIGPGHKLGGVIDRE